MANNLVANPMQISGSMASSYKTATAAVSGNIADANRREN